MLCRDGHTSTTADFCSECGLEMPPSGTAVRAAHRPDTSQLCPVCKTDRDDPSSPFCGVCGFNFETRQGGDVVHTAAAVAPAPVAPLISSQAAPRPAPAIGTTSTAHRIEIEVSFADDPKAPKGEPVRKFSLYDEENLIGRRSTGIAQTLGLDGDDYVSRRHVLLIRQPNGSYVVRLFDNTNGGQLNGVELAIGVERPLTVGDVIKIGTYTLVKVTGIK